MIAGAYENVLHIPMFGYSAKTISKAGDAAELFPLSRDLRNPFVPNNADIIDDMYTKCLKHLELSVPVNMKKLFQMLKQIGQ